ncbi:MAG: histidine phosphatase family protein [Clostridiales bacterium]|jgi:broad specificity phosphatase PhoE|nr:histidine phosphatase family protein [Clostridiales bacterium]
MKGERTVYLMRHGHIGEEGGPKRYTGITDTPLSASGHKQARALANWFCGRPVSGVYCSGLSRCVQTAAEIAAVLGTTPVAVRAMHEIRMGEWEGRTFEEIRARYPEAYVRRGKNVADFKPKGGESFSECEARAWEAFTGVLEASVGDVAVVAHAGVNRVLLRRMLGMDYQKLFCLRQDYGCINVIGCAGDAFTIRLLNFVPGR